MDDFTEATFRKVVQTISRHYQFEPYGTRSTNPHVLWRHDIDLSPHRAASLARIEHDEGVRGTYFVLLHSEFYNPFERSVTDLLREISSLGHWVGLHFDANFYQRQQDLGVEKVATWLRHERTIVEQLVEAPVEAFSLHNPTLSSLVFREDSIAGLRNASSQKIQDDYEYVSDSNGYWRFEPIQLVIERRPERLHVLTHPGWWQPTFMPARERVNRCVAGRAENTLKSYEHILQVGNRTDTPPTT